MAIRMKEWGMLATPGQPAHVRTQGLFGWERVGQSLGEGLSSALHEGVNVVRTAGELTAFSYRLRDIGRSVREELQECEVEDWGYAWNNAASPRIAEAVQELSPDVRERGMEMARSYSTQASIEAMRDRELQRIASARSQWQQRMDEAVSAGQEEEAASLLEAGRNVFVPEEQMPSRRQELRSRACHSRWEARLQASPMETLSALTEAEEKAEEGVLPSREEERRLLSQSCDRARRSLRREWAQRFSESLRAGEEPDEAALKQAAKAGIIPVVPQDPSSRESAPSDSVRSDWRRWLDCRADGAEVEQETLLTLASAPLPLEERRALLRRLERTAQVPAADRRALSNQLYSLYQAGAFGCPGDAEAQRALLSLQEEGADLLAEQGAEAVADWVKARRAGADCWVCFEEPVVEKKQA